MLLRKNLVVCIFVVAALGLLVVQYQYLKIGLVLADAQFSKKIDIARTTITTELSDYNSLTYSIARIMEKDTKNLEVSLDSLQRLTQFYLDDYITYQLGVTGIDASFTYALFTKDSTTVLTSLSPHLRNEDIRLYPIKIKGYLTNSIDKELVLELGFINLSDYFLYQLNGLTIPSLLFLLVLIAVVIWILNSFYGQSKLITTTNEFINNLTHELKTPVFSIALATKILEEDQSSDRKTILALIKRETERLKKHIEKVLELASLESGKMLIQLDAIDFRPALHQICESYETLSNYEHVAFTYQLEKGAYYIGAETFHLENAINNLLDNAKKYADIPNIRLESYVQGKNLHICIKDNGIGLTKKDSKRIFKKYYRVKNTNFHRVKGYGLGLTYVKKIISMHGGKIKVESEPEIGTTFTIVLPILNK